MDTLLLTLLSAALLLAPGQPGTAPAAGTGPFAALSPGNQKIAQALHDAQVRPARGSAPSPSRPTVFTRDQIAAMKQSGDGWGVILMRMQAAGQLRGARGVRQVVSGKYRPPASVTRIRARGSRGQGHPATAGGSRAPGRTPGPGRPQ